jgi:hypothetical protein
MPSDSCNIIHEQLCIKNVSKVEYCQELNRESNLHISNALKIDKNMQK